MAYPFTLLPIIHSFPNTALQLTPQLLKASLTKHINELLEPIRAEYTATPDWQSTDLQAYPPAVAATKVKKIKDKGDPAKRAAAAAAAAARKNVVAQPDGHVEGPAAQEVNLGSDTTATEMLNKLGVQDA